MNAKLYGALLGVALGLATPALADYIIKDGGGVTRTVAAGGSCGSDVICPETTLTDGSGAFVGTASNPLAFTFGTNALLPQFATPPHFICDSGCGGGGGGSSYTVTYGTAIGTLGTPAGFKDASGNFQPFLGDVTNGQWVNIKASVPIGVTGTFWQATQPVSGTFWPYTLGQQLSGASVPVVLPAAQVTALTPPTSVGISGTLPAFAATPTFNIGTAPTIAVTGAFFQATQPISAASLPLPAGAATQTTLASILTALGSPMQASGGTVGISGTLPAFAATPTFNIGTAPTITVTGSVTANAGTNLNTSLLALESGGNLASINTKTPALGQALAAASTPVVLTALQLTALTPLTSVAVTNAGTFATQATQAGTWNIGSITTLPALVAGSAIIGKVGIDQTTPGTTNGVQVNAALPTGTNLLGKTGLDQTTPGSTNGVTMVPSANAAASIAPVVSTSAESGHAFKASAGNVTSSAATNLTSTAGFYVLIDAATVPADGAITPKACAPLPANGSASISYGDIPGGFTTGIVGVVTSATTCFTKTTGVITAFLAGQVK